MARNNKNFGTFTAKALLPPPDGTLSGVYSSVGTLVTCPDQSYRDDLVEGAYVYDEDDNNEVRKVVRINRNSSAQSFIIDEPFTSDIVAESLDFVETTYFDISVATTGATDGIADGETLPPGIAFNARQVAKLADLDPSTPITIDGTGTTMFAVGIRS